MWQQVSGTQTQIKSPKIKYVFFSSIRQLTENITLFWQSQSLISLEIANLVRWAKVHNKSTSAVEVDSDEENLTARKVVA